MLRRIALLAAAVVLFLAATVADAAPRTACGALADASAPHRIHVVGSTCRQASAVAKAHWLQSGRFDSCARRRATCRVRGFRCAWGDAGQVRCRDGARQVRFRYET